MRHAILLALSIHPLLLGAQELPLPYRWNATGALITPRYDACAAPLQSASVCPAVV